MYQVLELDENYSTTRSVIKADPQEMSERVKQSNKPEDKFETVLFLPEGENRQGEGGLRTKGYFKVGGVLSHTGFDPVSPATALVIPVLDMGISKDEGHSGQESESPNPSVISSEAKQFTDTNVIERSDSDAAISKPLITVITVVFNGEIFLEETILSVINQTYDNVEYIIIDGGSTDGTLDVIRKFEHAIDYWVSEKDKGIYDAMNKGVSLATGDLIGLINADDYYHLETIRTVCNAYNSSHKDIYFGDKRLINEEQQIQKIVTVELPLSDRDVRLQSVHPTIFVNLRCYKKIRFNTCYKISADYSFFVDLFRLGVSTEKIHTVLATMREGGISSSFHLDVVRVTYHKFGSNKAMLALLKTVKSRFMAFVVFSLSKKLAIHVRMRHRGWVKIVDKCKYDSGEFF